MNNWIQPEPSIQNLFPCQVSTWNLQGKQVTKVSDWLSVSGYSPEVLMLQEVGGVPLLEGQLGPPPSNAAVPDQGLREVFLGPEHELHHYRIFCGSNESHLAQVIALDQDFVDIVYETFVGRRFVAVGIGTTPPSRKLMIVSCHLPHIGNSDEVFLTALHGLVTYVTSLRHQYDFLLGGDWNCAPGDERHGLWSVPLSLLGASFVTPCGPTRFGRYSNTILDHFVYFPRLCSRPARPLNAYDQVTVVDDSHQDIGSDHAFVIWDLAFVHASPLDRSRKVRRAPTDRCSRWVVRKDAPLQLGDTSSFVRLSLPAQWGALRGWAESISHRAPSLKYVDSEPLKELCSVASPNVLCFGWTSQRGSWHGDNLKGPYGVVTCSKEPPARIIMPSSFFAYNLPQAPTSMRVLLGMDLESPLSEQFINTLLTKPGEISSQVVFMIAQHHQENCLLYARF